MTRTQKIKQAAFDACLNKLRGRKDCQTAYALIMQVMTTDALVRENAQTRAKIRVKKI